MMRYLTRCRIGYVLAGGVPELEQRQVRDRARCWWGLRVALLQPEELVATLTRKLECPTAD